MVSRGRMLGAVGAALMIASLCSACSAAVPQGAAGVGKTDGGLPEFDSLQDAYQAVGEQLDCLDVAPPSTAVFGAEGVQLAGQSIKCTATVEVFSFDSVEARKEMRSALADAAAGPGSVYFAEGENWFVVDFSEVGRGVDTAGDQAAPSPTRQDLAGVAEALHAEYTVAT